MHKGFTLIELIVAVAIFSILILGVMALISNTFTVNRQQGGLLADQDQVRKVSFQVMSEVRNGTSSNVGAYPIDTAGDQQLIFYANIDGGLDIERVRYFVQNGKLYKGVVKPAGNPLTYNVASETTVVVQNNLAAGAAPIFYYYNDTYDGVTGAPLVQPVNVTAVRFVRIALPIANKAGVTNTNSYTVTAMATLRNLKTNLGAGAPPPAQPPTVDIKVNTVDGPITVAYNATATLAWTSSNATSCTASGAWTGSPGLSGSQSTGTLTATVTYSLQCTGPGGSISDSVTVQVSPPPAPTTDIKANGSDGPVTVAYNTTVTLTWTSATATSCLTTTNNWPSDALATSGSQTTAGLTSNQTYGLQCTGPGGSASDSVTVQVSAPPPPTPSCVSAAPESNNANGNGNFEVYAYGVSDTTSLRFDVYKGSTEIFVNGTNQGSGTWRGIINLSLIPSKGWYTVDVLVSNAGFTDVLCASTLFRRK